MTNNNPWIENTGTVPDGVGPDTVIEVEISDGTFEIDKGWANHKYWEIYGDDNIIRWRLV